jgi:nucleotide-binding universal stress UspA family protein
MGVYNHILLPLEGTDTDGPVLDHIAELAPICGAEVTLLRVAHFHTREERALEMEDAEGDIERAAQNLRARGVLVKTRIVPGEPGEVIVAQAVELGADLIAMATHGHGWAKRMVLGSVADHVRHNSDVPLLLVKRRGTAGQAEGGLASR